MRVIDLVGGSAAFVDDEDYERLACYRWYADVQGREGGLRRTYAVRAVCSNYRQRKIRMHREIMNALPHQDVDHINPSATLDNRKENLRLTTRQQNAQNRRKTSRATTSLYKGVSRSRNSNVWVAAIETQQKVHYLGQFRNEEDATRAYDIAAAKLFGEFAYLNFPK